MGVGLSYSTDNINSHLFSRQFVGRTKSKNSPTHPGTEKSGAKVVILGDLIKKIRKCIPTVLAVAISQNYPKAPKKNTIHPDF